ncbi:DNA fragmentation factor subunit alpha [Pangasianodon hypophthalmus]|uniref:DNA fragmentation factor subunit alpha n=1 Tax=Pangasianodon hypophthalmus TaxID=310915 RepID=UPI002307B7E2|nr:DNA fragmentation factor subunit alpha [Pangasianodon hypophthalmus]
MSGIKPCKVCNFSRQNYYGVVVVSLSQLKVKGSEALGYSADTSVSVVLDDDGTIVEDDAYFLCLPPNTKFMFLQDKEMWKPAKRFDGGTAWLMQSFDVGSDTVDSTNGGVEPWRGLADQLRQDLASIILMSEADLQSLVAVPCAVLASVLAFPEQKTKDLQDTLQRVLDRREEERQSRELLQLYLKVVEKERSQDLQQGETVPDEVDGIEVDSAVGFNAKTLLVLKGKTSPETRLSNEELQMVLKQGVETMMDELGWDRDRTAVLLQACEEELRKRLQQVQAMQSLSAHSQCSNSTSTTQPHKEETKAKRRK